MCGIAGYAGKIYDGLIDKLLTVFYTEDQMKMENQLYKMGESCHSRLSIIDLKNGQQPMKADGVQIVFNGEIYNYLELKTELKERL